MYDFIGGAIRRRIGQSDALVYDNTIYNAPNFFGLDKVTTGSAPNIQFGLPFTLTYATRWRVYRCGIALRSGITTEASAQYVLSPTAEVVVWEETTTRTGVGTGGGNVVFPNVSYPANYRVTSPFGFAVSMVANGTFYEPTYTTADTITVGGDTEPPFAYYRTEHYRVTTYTFTSFPTIVTTSLETGAIGGRAFPAFVLPGRYFVVLNDGTPPVLSAPACVPAGAGRTVLLTWGETGGLGYIASSNLPTYEIQRKQSTQPTWTTVAQSTTRTLTDSLPFVLAGMFYEYRVAVLVEGGRGVTYSNVATVPIRADCGNGDGNDGWTRVDDPPLSTWERDCGGAITTWERTCG